MTQTEEKKYYNINEVAERFGLNASTLRFWEKEFPQIKPKKGGRGVRRYTAADIETIRVVYNLVKVRGLKLQAARQYMNKNREGAQKITEAVERLRALRKELEQMRTALNLIE